MNPLFINITKEMRDAAIERDISAGKAFRRASIAGGKGRFYGFLGEQIVHAAFEGSILDPTSDYDIIFADKTWDVKTKVRKDQPKPWFDGTVDDSANHQRPDFYVFVSILGPHLLINKDIDEIRKYEYTKAWIMGFVPRNDFYRLATHFSAGDTDPSNGLRYRDNTSLIKYDKLLDVNKLLRALKSRSA